MPRAKKAAAEETKVEEAVVTRKPTIRDFDIIRGPIHTEKTQGLQTDHNTIVLEVCPTADKDEIKKAVEAIFGVKVDRVNTITVRKKAKRVGRYDGFTKGYKKAIVTLNKSSDLGEIAKASRAE